MAAPLRRKEETPFFFKKKNRLSHSFFVFYSILPSKFSKEFHTHVDLRFKWKRNYLLSISVWNRLFVYVFDTSLPYDSGNKTGLWIGSSFGLQFTYALVIFAKVFDDGIWRWSICLLLWVDSGVGCFFRVLCKTSRVCDRMPCCYSWLVFGSFFVYVLGGLYVLCHWQWWISMLMMVDNSLNDWDNFWFQSQLLVLRLCVILIAGWWIWWMVREFFFGPLSGCFAGSIYSLRVLRLGFVNRSRKLCLDWDQRKTRLDCSWKSVALRVSGLMRLWQPVFLCSDCR